MGESHAFRFSQLENALGWGEGWDWPYDKLVDQSCIYYAHPLGYAHSRDIDNRKVLWVLSISYSSSRNSDNIDTVVHLLWVILNDAGTTGQTTGRPGANYWATGRTTGRPAANYPPVGPSSY